MKVLCKNDRKYIFSITYFFKISIQSQQLALPIQIITAVVICQISINNFVARNSDYHFSSGIKNNIIASHSIVNNITGEYLLLDDVTLPITEIELLNNKSHLTRILKQRKNFLFQLTNFIA